MWLKLATFVACQVDNIPLSRWPVSDQQILSPEHWRISVRFLSPYCHRGSIHRVLLDGDPLRGGGDHLEGQRDRGNCHVYLKQVYWTAEHCPCRDKGPCKSVERGISSLDHLVIATRITNLVYRGVARRLRCLKGVY